MARERLIEYWENNRIAVTRSLTKTIASTVGLKLTKAGSCTLANGAVIVNAASSTNATAKTTRRCCWVAGRVESETGGLSGTWPAATSPPRRVVKRRLICKGQSENSHFTDVLEGPASRRRQHRMWLWVGLGRSGVIRRSLAHNAALAITLACRDSVAPGPRCRPVAPAARLPPSAPARPRGRRSGPRSFLRRNRVRRTPGSSGVPDRRWAAGGAARPPGRADRRQAARPASARSPWRRPRAARLRISPFFPSG